MSMYFKIVKYYEEEIGIHYFHVFSANFFCKLFNLWDKHTKINVTLDEAIEHVEWLKRNKNIKGEIVKKLR